MVTREEFLAASEAEKAQHQTVLDKLDGLQKKLDEALAGTDQAVKEAVTQVWTEAVDVVKSIVPDAPVDPVDPEPPVEPTPEGDVINPALPGDTIIEDNEF